MRQLRVRVKGIPNELVDKVDAEFQRTRTDIHQDNCDSSGFKG